MFTHRLAGLPAQWRLTLSLLMLLILGGHAAAQQLGPPAANPMTPASGPQITNGSPLTSIVHKVLAPNERIEMIVSTSRILTLDKKIPQVQVNNPDIVELHVLSPNEVQVFAKASGVTQVNLWSEDKKIYAIDVVVYADAQALSMLLRSEFPRSSVKAIPVASGVLLSGTVEKPEQITQIVQLAEQFYPKVLNHMNVGGVQQVLLHVKLLEVSRTKLRQLGFDFAKITGANLVQSSVSGILAGATNTGATLSGTPTFAFSVHDGSSAFFGVLDALRKDNLMKVLAEPSLVCINGRPGYFNVGGEFPILIPQSLGTVSIEFKKFGTQLDFVPIVLGNGRIRLEVKPKVSEIDSSRSITIGNTTVPGLRVREAETGVEMTAGQTLAIAGLVQIRDEAENKGLPWVSDVPYVGALFRRVQHSNNEIELMILVTPELVEAVDPQNVPPGGPGLETTEPSDVDLYLKGHLEVPNCRAACHGPRQGMGAACVAPVSYQVPPREEGMMPGPPVPEPIPAPEGNGVSSPSASGNTARLPAGNSRVSPSTGDTQPSGGSDARRQTRYNSSQPDNSAAVSSPARSNPPPGLIGPVGYDVK